MTKLQQHVNFVNATEKLLSILDKVEQTNGSEIYKQQAREQRRHLKTMVIQCRMPNPADKQVYKHTNKLNHSRAAMQWLAK